MWEVVFRPLTQRLSTAIGSALTAIGMTNPDVDVVLAAVPVLLGFAVDLTIRRWF